MDRSWRRSKNLKNYLTDLLRCLFSTLLIRRSNERKGLIYMRGCQERSSPFAGGAVFVRAIQSLVTTEDASLGWCPAVWFVLFHLVRGIFWS